MGRVTPTKGWMLGGLSVSGTSTAVHKLSSLGQRCCEALGGGGSYSN